MMIITDTPPPTVKRLGGEFIISLYKKNLEISNNGLSKFYVAKQIDITFW